MADHYRYLSYKRLEPKPSVSDLQVGFRAEVHDPLWFLGRQWQMGEHHGDDASSPVKVTYTASHLPLRDERSGMDPTVTPVEAIVESEPDQWWTPGRRIRIGARVSSAAGLPSPKALANLPLRQQQLYGSLLLRDLPEPYQRLTRQGYDGWKLYKRREELYLKPMLFDDVPQQNPIDFWDASRFEYSTRFSCGEVRLELAGHEGGDVDWYSVDSNRPLLAVGERRVHRVFPSHLTYPGAPHPRWWQIEDAQVDIGGFPPDRSHFATMLLIDLIASHSDDWFVFPVNSLAGHVVTLHKVIVRDSFDDEWEVVPPGSRVGAPRPVVGRLRDLEAMGERRSGATPTARGWSLFAVRDLDDLVHGVRSLPIWPTAVTPLAGPQLEEVIFGLDEDSNMLWAVERRLGGRDLPTPERPAAQEGGEAGQPLPTFGPREYQYLFSTHVYSHWQPYIIDEDSAGRRRFVQGRLADLNGIEPVLMPPATAVVLRNLNAAQDDPVHHIDPSVIPNRGLRLERRYMLARDINGQPVLWLQRRRLPMLAPPQLPVRYDVVR